MQMRFVPVKHREPRQQFSSNPLACLSLKTVWLVQHHRRVGRSVVRKEPAASKDVINYCTNLYTVHDTQSILKLLLNDLTRQPPVGRDYALEPYLHCGT